MTARGLPLGLGLALLLAPGALLAADAPMLQLVRGSYGYDARNDRLIFGGYPWGAIQRGDYRGEAPEAQILYRSPLRGGSKRLLFREASGMVAQFRVSSAGLVAFLTSKRVLRVLDPNGRILRSIEDVIDYQWSSDGMRLGYCTGQYDGPNSDARPLGTWLLELAGGAAWRVFEGGRQVAWASFDGGLYVYDVPGHRLSDDRVWRYDTRDRTLVETRHRGIYFSPSGSFYFMDSDGRGTFDVYEANTRRSLRASSGMLKYLYAEPVGWLEGHDLLVLESWYDGAGGKVPAERSVLYDPRTDRITELGAVAVIGFGRGHTVVFIEDGAVRVEKNESWARKAERPRAE